MDKEKPKPMILSEATNKKIKKMSEEIDGIKLTIQDLAKRRGVMQKEMWLAMDEELSLDFDEKVYKYDEKTGEVTEKA